MQTLKPLLEAEGFAVFHQESQTDHGTDQLIIPLAKEDGSALNIELNQISDTAGTYPQTHFIQCFITLNIEIDKMKEAMVKSFIQQINLELPLGSFHFHEAGIVFYKYTIIVDRAYPKDANIDSVLNALDISNHLFQTYESPLLKLLKDS